MPSATPRPAATLVLVRPAPGGCRVYMQKRADTLRFAPGFHVFPGGALDGADADPALIERLDGGGRWAPGEPAVTPAHVVAALRECYEEAGVLVARDRSGRSAHADAARAARLAAARADVERAGDGPSLAALLDREGLRLDGGALRYFSHWVTPSTSPVRFDTRFFLVTAPEGARPAPCSGESVEGAWWDPASALSAYEADAMKLLWPTETTLRFLRQFHAFEEIIDACDDASLKIQGIRL